MTSSDGQRLNVVTRGGFDQSDGQYRISTTLEAKQESVALLRHA
jgi:hypothetical protein